MFVDYEYYQKDFKGSDLTEEEFNKYGNLACMEVSANTLSRVKDDSINSFPEELISRIKSCVCAIAEYKKKFDDSLSFMTCSQGQGKSQGIIRSKTAGAVSVSYDTNASLSYLLNPKKQKEIIDYVLRSYLSPACFGGTLYNLLSKVIGGDSCV